MFLLVGSSRNWLHNGTLNSPRHVSTITKKLREEARKVLQKSSNATNEIVAKGKALQHGSGFAKDDVRSTANTLSDQMQSVSKSASTSASEVSSRAISLAKLSSSKASAVASSRIQGSTFGVLGNVTDVAKVSLRWLWWWSLAVVAVYGIATTLPKELLRYAVTNDSNEASEPKGIQIPTTTNGGSWPHWAGLGPTKNTSDQRSSRWSLSWFTEDTGSSTKER